MKWRTVQAQCIWYHSVKDQFPVQFPPFPVSIPNCKKTAGPTDLHRTEQVSDSYAWQIAISHELGLKEMGVK